MLKVLSRVFVCLAPLLGPLLSMRSDLEEKNENNQINVQSYVTKDPKVERCCCASQRSHAMKSIRAMCSWKNKDHHLRFAAGLGLEPKGGREVLKLQSGSLDGGNSWLGDLTGMKTSELYSNEQTLVCYEDPTTEYGFSECAKLKAWTKPQKATESYPDDVRNFAEKHMIEKEPYPKSTRAPKSADISFDRVDRNHLCYAIACNDPAVGLTCPLPAIYGPPHPDEDTWIKGRRANYTRDYTKKNIQKYGIVYWEIEQGSRSYDPSICLTNKKAFGADVGRWISNKDSKFTKLHLEHYAEMMGGNGWECPKENPKLKLCSRHSVCKETAWSKVPDASSGDCTPAE